MVVIYMAILSKMEDSGCISDAVTYAIVIQALFGKSKIDMAEKLLFEMVARSLL